MGKECSTWLSNWRLWGGGNTSPLKTTAWEATVLLKCKNTAQTNIDHTF